MELLRKGTRNWARISGLRSLVFALMLVAAWAGYATAGVLPDEADVAAYMQPLIDDGSYVGIVVGIVGPSERRVFSFGSVSRDFVRRPTPKTVFPLASITKVFTGVLLADFVERGIVRLEDPVVKYLPRGVIADDNPLARATLLDLATHTSGLPKTPDKAHLRPRQPRKPYSVEQMYEFLSNYRPEEPPGSSFRYSNIGMALLGHILELASGVPYGRLVQNRICGPLGMAETRVSPTPAMRRRMARGYDKHSRPVQVREFGVGKSSGGLYSTTDDMMDFLAANMGLSRGMITPALMFAQKPLRRLPGKEHAFMGLGWHVRRMGNREIVSKNGALAGYHSFAAFSKTDGIGIIAFGNSGPPEKKLDSAVRKLLRELIFRDDVQRRIDY